MPLNVPLERVCPLVAQVAIETRGADTSCFDKRAILAVVQDALRRRRLGARGWGW